MTVRRLLAGLGRHRQCVRDRGVLRKRRLFGRAWRDAAIEASPQHFLAKNAVIGAARALLYLEA
ncbi:MAG: hypothetical protein J0L92_24830 [Deltaproteobacteria bacterium]|nr:hypothetical protein [Deltaproteobacteria bacterium]